MEDCKHLESHEQRFCTIENESKTKVSWIVFAWAIGILSAVLFYSVEKVSSIENRVSSSDIEMAKVQTKLVSIETLLVEIKGDIRTEAEKH
jgi:hypothetical protein